MKQEYAHHSLMYYLAYRNIQQKTIEGGQKRCPKLAGPTLKTNSNKNKKLIEYCKGFCYRPSKCNVKTSRGK